MPNKRTIRSAHHVEYCALKHAMDRCDNPQHGFYHNYGGRGIKVAEVFYGTWGFYKFIEEVGLRPGPEYSLDRIDNDKGYEPGNLRWATRKQQQQNTRKTHTLERDHGHGFGSYTITRRDGKPLTMKSPYVVHPDGTKKMLIEWARDLNLATTTLRQRLMKGWPLERALSPQLFCPGDTIRLKKAKAAPSTIDNVIDLLDASIHAISKRVH